MEVYCRFSDDLQSFNDDDDDNHHHQLVINSFTSVARPRTLHSRLDFDPKRVKKTRVFDARPLHPTP